MMRAADICPQMGICAFFPPGQRQFRSFGHAQRPAGNAGCGAGSLREVDFFVGTLTLGNCDENEVHPVTGFRRRTKTLTVAASRGSACLTR